MKDIPGTRIGNGASTFGDFNGDGLDEVFQYAFGGNGKFIFIIGYDETEKKIDYSCNIRFALLDPKNSPVPFEFMTYQGVEGFKVYQDIYNGPPIHKPKHLDDTGLSWYFYAWDEGSRKYVELAEIGEDIDYTMFSNYKAAIEEEPEEIAPVPEEQAVEGTAPVVSQAEPERRNLIPIIGIVAGVLALILGVCGILLIRRKKK
jgi:hypothetical protein